MRSVGSSSSYAANGVTIRLRFGDVAWRACLSTVPWPDLPDVALPQCAVLRLVIGAVGAGLESITVQYDDLASRQPDESPLLKIVQSNRDASTTHPKYARQELVGERNSSPSRRSLAMSNQRAKRSSMVAVPFERAVIAIWFMKE